MVQIIWISACFFYRSDFYQPQSRKVFLPEKYPLFRGFVV